MNLWRRRNINTYLYEIIEDYKTADSEEEQKNIITSFCSSIWSSNNQRRVYTKTIKFKIRKDLLDTEIGQVFKTYAKVEYTGYQSISKETDWCSLLRQKINNLYTRYFDKEVILQRDYLELLQTPKRLYYSWMGGTELTPEELVNQINDAIYNAEKLKTTYQKQKMELSWSDFQKLMERFFEKFFHNCKLIEEYEETCRCSTIYDFMNEDNFYIKYFCKCLEGEMLKWQKRYYGVREHKKYKRCCDCNRLFEIHSHNQKRCVNCQTAYNRRNKTQKQRKYRVEKLKH